MPRNDELRELHEDYTWEVNAAVGRDEDAVVVRLVSEYTDRALRLITEWRPDHPLPGQRGR